MSERKSEQYTYMNSIYVYVLLDKLNIDIQIIIHRQRREMLKYLELQLFEVTFGLLRSKRSNIKNR